MGDFKDQVPHTGGVLTIHKQGDRYALSYEHSNPHPAVFAELLVIDGEPVSFIDLGGLYANDDPPPTEVRAFLPSDSEGMFGRVCPGCKSYFRAGIPSSRFCPYCMTVAHALKYLTSPQCDFLRRQHDAIVAALAGPDGNTSVSFDEQVAQPTRNDTWVYSEEKQQTRFKCTCRLEYDVLGEYVRCPNCGKRTARQVFTRKLAALSADLEADAQRIPTDQREERERRWRHYVVACVAEFEALGRDVAMVLSWLPCVPARRTALGRLSFQSVLETAERLREWFGFDLLRGIDQQEQTFIARMFGRRHLFSHNSGRVDQEYLEKTRDTSVRLHEVVTVRSSNARQMIALVQKIGAKLLDDFESME